MQLVLAWKVLCTYIHFPPEVYTECFFQRCRVHFTFSLYIKIRFINFYFPNKLSGFQWIHMIKCFIEFLLYTSVHLTIKNERNSIIFSYAIFICLTLLYTLIMAIYVPTQIPSFYWFFSIQGRLTPHIENSDSLW